MTCDATGAPRRIHSGLGSEVERTIDRLNNFRAVATRYDRRADVFHGTVTLTVAAIWLWLVHDPPDGTWR